MSSPSLTFISGRLIDERTFMVLCSEVQATFNRLYKNRRKCIVTPLDRIEGGFMVSFPEESEKDKSFRFVKIIHNDSERVKRYGRMFEKIGNEMRWGMFYDEDGRHRNPEDWVTSNTPVIPEGAYVCMRPSYSGSDKPWSRREVVAFKSTLVDFGFEPRRSW